MTAPERNLPPDAQAWGRFVDEFIRDAARRLDIGKSNINTVSRQAAGGYSAAADAKVVAEDATEKADAAQDTADSKNSSEMAVHAPKNPVHGDTYYDPADGNVQKMYVDYGPSRTNWVVNPTFYASTVNWSVQQGTLTWLTDRSAEVRVTSTTPLSIPGVTEHFGTAPNLLVQNTARVLVGAGPDPAVPLPGQPVPTPPEGPVEPLPPSPTPPPASEPGTLEPVGEPVLFSTVVTNTGTTGISVAAAVLTAQGVVSASERVSIAAGESARIFALPIRNATAIATPAIMAFGNTTARFTIDEAIAEKVPVPYTEHPYFDGTFPGCEWVELNGQLRSVWSGVPRWANARDMKLVAEVAALNAEVAEELEGFAQDLQDANTLLEAIDAAGGPEGVAAAISEYLSLSASLSDLLPGTPIPAVVTDFWDKVVVAKFLVSTEKIITKDVIATGAVTASALNVIETLPNGARFSLQPDGMRLWAAGNTGPNPNLSITLADGFRISRDDGTAIMWFDPATGNLHTSGAVLSNAMITAPLIEGGTFRTGTTGRRVELSADNPLRAWNNLGTQVLGLDGSGNVVIGGNFTATGGTVSGATLAVSTPDGIPVFHASPTGGVTIGGASAIFTQSGYIDSTATSTNLTPAVPVVGGQAYGWTALMERSGGWDIDQVWLEAVWQVNTATVAETITTVGWLAVLGQSSLIESAFIAPNGATSVTIRARRVPGTPAAGEFMRFQQVAITGMVKGNVTIGGAVRAERVITSTLEAGEIRDPRIRGTIQSHDGQAGGERVVVNDHLQVNYTLFANTFAPRTGSEINFTDNYLYGVTRIGRGGTGNALSSIHFDGGNTVRAPGIRENTNTNAANVFINSSGVLHQATSAARYKAAVEGTELDHAERILSVEPKTWFDTGDAERYAQYLTRCEAYGPSPNPADLDNVETLARVPGLVAEDVEAAGLEEFVVYSGDGRVDGLAYDRLWTLLIPVVRKQREQIDTLTARLEAIEARLSDLGV